jgi:hypothetical protein
MKHIFTKIIIASSFLISSYVMVYSAAITINAPAQALSNRQPIVVQFFLDPEQDTISGISGNFSYDTDLFTLSDISTESSIVSLWITQPSLSEEKNIDSRIHITFEGIFPGGYDGVRSPYYNGVRPGRIFAVTLIPKNKGTGTFIVDDIALNAYNSDATPLKTQSAIQAINVPDLIGSSVTTLSPMVEITSPTLSAIITRNPLINSNAWYLLVNEREQKSAIENIYVAETSDWTGEQVSDSAWRKSGNPYILLYQNRTKYINIKVVYADNTYTLKTIPPVENSGTISERSRILVSVALALLFVLLVLYFYAKYSFTIVSKKE